MDLYRLNLNLLVALDTLFAERNVTLSAKKLFITQAAMSNNLQQLREIFKDELLVREKNQMVLTHYARDLQPKLHQVISEVRSLVTSGQQFCPKTSERTFKLGMCDYMAVLVLPKILKVLETEAPGVNITIVPIDRLGMQQNFDEGCYDFILGKPLLNQYFPHKEPLFQEKVVCILNPRHPLAKKPKLTLKDYLAYPHAAIKIENPNVLMVVEDALTKLNTQRNIKIGLPFIVPMLQLIDQSSTLIGTMIEGITKIYRNKYNFVTKPVPFTTNIIQYYLMWHSRFKNDVGHQWLRQKIIELCSNS